MRAFIHKIQTYTHTHTYITYMHTPADIKCTPSSSMLFLNSRFLK